MADTCQVCGLPLAQVGGRGHRARLYCDDRCRQRSYRIRTKPVSNQETLQARVDALEQEIQTLRQQLDVERRFRTDTEIRHLKSWLRGRPLPPDADFFQRFLADTRLPLHASRAMYEARLRQYGYSAEDIALFQGIWKDLLFQS